MTETSEKPMTCQELVETITDYLEDRLPAEERSRFDAHLAICAGCRNYLEQMRETIRLTGQVTEEALPSETRQRLLEAFRGLR